MRERAWETVREEKSIYIENTGHFLNNKSVEHPPVITYK